MSRSGETCKVTASLVGVAAGEPAAWAVAEPFGPFGRGWSSTDPGSLERSRVQAWAVILLVLSALDFLVTAWLLRTSPLFYEANPVAQWFLARWGLAGLMGFKFVVISGVIALGGLIERRRVGWGRLVLAFGSVAATCAIVQGASLLRHPAMTGEAEAADDPGEIAVVVVDSLSELSSGEPVLIVPAGYPIRPVDWLENDRRQPSPGAPADLDADHDPGVVVNALSASPVSPQLSEMAGPAQPSKRRLPSPIHDGPR